jgi:23S rRNA pseudouridine2605 synthase
LVKGEPNQDQLDAWRRGVVLIDQETGKRLRTRPAHVKREAPAGDHTWLRVTMQEGRKHEIRDIGATLGLPVVRLIRVRLASLLLGDLRPGEWRALKPAEVKALATGAPPPAEAGRRGGERRLAKPADGRRPPKPPDGRRPAARTRQNPTRRAAKRG